MKNELDILQGFLDYCGSIKDRTINNGDGHFDYTQSTELSEKIHDAQQALNKLKENEGP